MQKGGLFGFLMVLYYFGFNKGLKICNKMIPVTTKLSLSLIRYGKLNFLVPLEMYTKQKFKFKFSKFDF